MARQTLKTLRRSLDDHTVDNAASLSVKLGRESFTLDTGEYIGAATGERFAYVVTGKKTMLVELDRAKKAARVLSDEQANRLLADIAADLLPVPEEPEEVKAAREALAALKLPKGWTLAYGKGGVLDIVQADGQTAAKRQRAPRGSSTKPKASPKPEIKKGLKLTRVKDGAAFTVQKAGDGRMTLKGDTSGETIETSTAPIMWRYWQA